MSAKHTPGPWRVGYRDGSGAEEGCACITHRGSAVVAGGDSFGSKYGVILPANAKLIAAAPALADALEQAVQCCHGRHVHEPECELCGDWRLALRAAGRIP